MPRALWKGAISFGLVHVPVALYPAARADELGFDMLDKRDMAHIGYKRYNKETGKEIERENIVKGLEYESGHYVVLSDEEIRGANVKMAQTVEIVAFVNAADISPTYYETPYYLAPTARGEKVYTLLRETLKREKKVGIAYVVIQTKQHLAALMPIGDILVLNTLRWATEVRAHDELAVPTGGIKSAGLRDQEIKMASQLVESMTEEWKPEQYKDTFRDELLKMVEGKVKKGETQQVNEPPPDPSERTSAKVIDLTELLKRSLATGARKPAQKPHGGAAPAAPRNGAPRTLKAVGNSAGATKTKAKSAAKPAVKSVAQARSRAEPKRTRKSA